MIRIRTRGDFRPLKMVLNSSRKVAHVTIVGMHYDLPELDILLPVSLCYMREGFT